MTEPLNNSLDHKVMTELRLKVWPANASLEWQIIRQFCDQHYERNRRDFVIEDLLDQLGRLPDVIAEFYMAIQKTQRDVRTHQKG